MRVTLASYEAVSLIHGGPRVQILETKKELERLGVEVRLFEPWEGSGSLDCDILHLFSANLGTFHFARNIHTLPIRLVTSPIFYTQRSAGAIRLTLAVEAGLKSFKTGIWTDYGYTKQICDWSQMLLPNTGAEAMLIRQGMNISPRKIRVVPNGVRASFEFGDPSLFRKKYGIDRFILNVGHIGPRRKNVLSLIHALSKIDHPAVIIGKVVGDDGELCVKEAEKNKNLLIIPGLENDSELLASAYAAADVFVLPSLYETPGIAALEAGLAGAKIVITPAGGTREYFGDMARYVEPGSTESIRDGIMAALTMKRTEMLRSHIRQEYLWSKVAEKTLAAYREILN